MYVVDRIERLPEIAAHAARASLLVPSLRFSLSAIVTRRIFQRVSYRPRKPIAGRFREKTMDWNESTRRSFLKQFGAAGAAALAAANADGHRHCPAAGTLTPQPAPTPADQKQAATRDARMAWWHEAKFGMFIHWGLYSVIGQHEWAKEHEGVPHSAIRDSRQALPSQAQRRARLGAAGQARRPEVHGDDHQAPRGLLQLGYASSPTTTP